MPTPRASSTHLRFPDRLVDPKRRGWGYRADYKGSGYRTRRRSSGVAGLDTGGRELVGTADRGGGVTVHGGVPACVEAPETEGTDSTRRHGAHGDARRAGGRRPAHQPP